MNRLRFLLFYSLLGGALLHAPAAAAQDSLAGCVNWNRLSQSAHQVSENHIRFTGNVEIVCDQDTFFADEMDVYTDTNLIEARGNVTFAAPEAQVHADRMTFNTKTRTGVFYNAFGTANVTQKTDRSLFGTQEPIAMFWGTELHKLGPDKYRIKKGGFTTCVQPTPRWEIVTDSATIRLDHYALARNPVLKVKGVPLFYAPIIYYPINKEDRATGFLIPTYGTSTLRGQSISNAFFWAINRSQDATFFDDWYTATGHGVGSEYRYVTAPGSQGNARFYFLDEKSVESTAGTVSPARRSYEIRSNAAQALPGRLNARVNVNYFSDLSTQQYYYGIYNSSLSTRTVSGNVTGSWGPYVLNTTLNHSQTFYNATSSTLTGTLPQINFSRSERPIGSSPVYVSVNTEFATLLRKSVSGTTERDQGLSRVDVMPTVRVPFTRWPFLTLNTSLSWRDTYWTQSLDESGVQVPQGVSRRYWDFTSQVTGPTFNRIWDRPSGRYARKIKHVIEPSFTFERSSPIDVFKQVVKLDGKDLVVGNVTSLAYGVTSRLYVKPSAGGQAAPALDILDASVTQSYFTDANAAKYDPNYSTSFTGNTRSNFTPIRLTLRASPTPRTSGQFSTEYDAHFHGFRSFNANGSVSAGWLQATGGWSRTLYIKGYNSTGSQSDAINTSTTLRFKQGRVGGTYALNYDLYRNYVLQQRVIGYYNAQCCGIAMEFQTYNFLFPDPRTGLSHDRRFNISFTLAGVGTFSNLLGAFGGNQTR
jgi:LPS-assembly protein